jgi:hypothetical protein
VHARKRGVESFGKREKMSIEGKIKRKVCVWKRKKKKNIKERKKNKYMYKRIKERREREKRSGNQDM